MLKSVINKYHIILTILGFILILLAVTSGFKLPVVENIIPNEDLRCYSLVSGFVLILLGMVSYFITTRLRFKEKIQEIVVIRAKLIESLRVITGLLENQDSGLKESTILIADDDQYIRDDLTECLRNHKLFYATTAKETLARVIQEKPNLVLLDLKLPDCQDLSLLKKIREQVPTTEIIILSMYIDNISIIVEAIKAGALDFIAKPYSPEELDHRISRAFETIKIRRTQECLFRELQSIQDKLKLDCKDRLSNRLSNRLKKYP
jgi:PleD family two-component response regulator